FFFQAEDGIRDFHVTGVQTCALPISMRFRRRPHFPPLPDLRQNSCFTGQIEKQTCSASFPVPPFYPSSMPWPLQAWCLLQPTWHRRGHSSTSPISKRLTQ